MCCAILGKIKIHYGKPLDFSEYAKEMKTDKTVEDKVSDIIKEEIYQMSYITIVRYLALNPITIDDKIVPIEKINLKFLYSKYKTD